MHRDILLGSRIDLLALLAGLEDYILIKKDDFFPGYAVGSDIDLLVFDREESLRRIVDYHHHHMAGEGELRITDAEGHCHADFLFDGALEIRLDLIDGFDFFQNIAVKPAYLTKLFMDRRIVKYGERTVFVPGPEDDLTLRYFEYLEWFDRRPDKIKHLDYICEVEDEALKQRFFNNTHRFIQFKRKTWLGPVPARQPDVQPANQTTCKLQSRRQALKLIRQSVDYLISTTFRKWRDHLHQSRQH